MTNHCRACPAPVRWVRMARTGKWNPLDLDPDEERGNVLIDEAGRGHAFANNDAARGYRLMHPEMDGPYLSHFATCPKRGHFKR